MNYPKIYHLLVEKADNRCILPGVYKESHHIVPKCMGGSDQKSNIVQLFPAEHFIMHQLLTKIYPDNHGLVCAAFMMSSYKKHGCKKYAWLKKNHAKIVSDLYKGSGNPMYGKPSPMTGKKHSKEAKKKMSLAKMGENNRMFGKHLPKETRIKLSKALQGHKHSDETKKKISEAGKNITDKTRQKMIVSGKNRPKISEITRQKLSDAGKGKNHSEETLEKLRSKAKNRKKVICPYCDKIGSISQMKRWHFDNCKNRI